MAESPEVVAPIEVVIADKNPLVRAGLEQLFAQDDRFRLLATTVDGERFLRAVEMLSFDVAVIGWSMPHLSGRGVLQALRGRPGGPRIVVYTGSDDPDTPRQVMALGGAGYCSKTDVPEQLLETVAAVAAGRMVFPFVDVRTLSNDPLAGLTCRERELLAALATGRTTKQIAADLDISANTVKFHLKNLYGKLNIANRAQAVAVYVGSQARLG